MFAPLLLSFFDKNEVICGHAGRIDLVAHDLWDVDLKIEWKGLGQVSIRNAANEDFAALKEFLLAGLSDHSRFLFAPYPYAEDLDAALTRVFSECQQRQMLLFHAWHESQIIGHFYLGGMSGPVPDLGIAVADRCHGKKLGNLFMTLLIAAGHFAGSQAIVLTTNPQNFAGFHLYQKVGFVHTGDREIILGDGSKRIEHELIYTMTKDQ